MEKYVQEHVDKMEKNEIEKLHEITNNSGLISQQFEELIYELLKKDTWPTAEEIKGYFKLPPPPFRYKMIRLPTSAPSIAQGVVSTLKRHVMCSKFTFAIPTFELLQVITKYQPILEIGAGSGFWAALLKKNNCDIIATTINDEYHPFPEKFTEIEKLPAIDAVKKYPDRTVFCSWPSIGTWTEETLPHIKKRLILISENATASDKFYDTLSEDFKQIEEHKIPEWFGIRDKFSVFERK